MNVLINESGESTKLCQRKELNQGKESSEYRALNFFLSIKESDHTIFKVLILAHTHTHVDNKCAI